MTTEDLTAIKARYEAATPGPWTVDERDCRVLRAPNAAGEHQSLMGDEQHYPWTPDRNEDWQFIAHARTDVPTLVEEVERAMDVIRSIIWASDHCQGHGECAHSMSPWSDARELLYEFENEQEALVELRRRRHGDFGRG